MNQYRISLNGKQLDIHFRQESLSDIDVIKQVLIRREYATNSWDQHRALLSYSDDQEEKNGAPLIIDAGANIGASSVYFSHIFSSSLVYALEPEANNFELLELNSRDLNIQAYQTAIACDETEMFLQDPGIGDWGFRVCESGLQKVQTITPDLILQSEVTSNTFPFIFKIDIEGGEENLFNKNTEWVDEFPLIIIELHDWMFPFAGNSNNFIKAIQANDFDILSRGENLFCFNRRLLKDYI